MKTKVTSNLLENSTITRAHVVDRSGSFIDMRLDEFFLLRASILLCPVAQSTRLSEAYLCGMYETENGHGSFDRTTTQLFQIFLIHIYWLVGNAPTVLISTSAGILPSPLFGST